MRARCGVVMVAMIVCLGGLVLAQEEEAPLQNWTAPPYWQPTAQRAKAEGEPGANLIARSQGLSGEPQDLPSAPLPFVAITPCRIIDTRPGYALPPPFGGPTFAAGETRAYDLSLSSTCPGIPATAGAYSINIHAQTITIPGFITVWPAGFPRPTASMFMSVPTSPTALAAPVPAGASGQISVYYNAAGDVWIDINGYYGPSGTLGTWLTGEGIGVDSFGGFMSVGDMYWQTVESSVAAASPMTGTIDSLRVYSSDNCPGQKIFRLRVNGINTDVTCIVDVTPQCQNLTTSAPVAFGQAISVYTDLRFSCAGNAWWRARLR